MRDCPNCASHDLVNVELQLGGEPVNFAHCRRCEHRWWSDVEGRGIIALSDVLTKAAVA
ncbi:MAG TPA: hypothetical protein VML96_01650 [Egibacteraceae bacterium]|nr:hypothetical protein [Egibacteraceae bacterium]